MSPQFGRITFQKMSLTRSRHVIHPQQFVDNFERKKESIFVTQNMTCHEVFGSAQNYKDTTASPFISGSLCYTKCN